MKNVLIFLLLFCFSSCSSQRSNIINGQYVKNGNFYSVSLIQYTEQKNIGNGISTLPLYKRIDNGEGSSFYWTKVSDGYKSTDGKNIPPTFKFNQLWPID